LTLVIEVEILGPEEESENVPTDWKESRRLLAKIAWNITLF